MVTYTENDLIESCYSACYVKTIRILQNIKKPKKLTDEFMNCYITVMNLLHEDLLIKILEYNQSIVIEFNKEFDTFVLLYALELGLYKLSHAILNILKIYEDLDDKKEQLNLKYSNEIYTTLLQHRNKRGDDILMIALYSNDTVLISKIFDLKDYGEINYSNVNVQLKNALMISIGQNMLKTAKYIMDKCNVEDINYTDFYGNTPFLYTIFNEQFDFMFFMLRHENVKYDGVNYRSGMNALHYLCMVKHENYALFLINKCPELIYQMNNKNEYPLIMACENGLNSIIIKILSMIVEHPDLYYMFSILNDDLKSVKNNYLHNKYVGNFYDKYIKSIEYKIM